MGPDRLTDTGLSRYAGSGNNIPPEVEEGAFDYVLKPAAARHHLSVDVFQKRYNDGTVIDRQLNNFLMQDRAVRESGHDTTYRWRVLHADRASDFVTVDLNSLLYRYELDLARWSRTEFHDEAGGKNWQARADHRRELMLKYLWDTKLEMFMDYNFKTHQRSSYVSATGFYPFWAEDATQPATAFLPLGVARRSLQNLVQALEAPGGLAATSEASLKSVLDRPVPRQWDFPNGWAPHQMIAWEALAHHGP